MEYAHKHLFDLCDLKRSHPAGACAVYRVRWYSILYTVVEHKQYRETIQQT